MSEYSKNLLISDKYAGYIIDSMKYKWNILHGGVRAGKGVINCLAFCLRLERYETSRELIFLACAVSESMAKALLGENNGYGIAYYFDKCAEYKKYKGMEALKITLKKNNKNVVRWVLFCGGAKADSYKSIRGLSVEGIIASEVNLFHPDFMEECKRRQVAAIDPFNYFDANPTFEGHWIYSDYIDNKNLNVNYMNVTLLDNAALTKERIDDVISEYDPDSDLYKAAIEGKRINLSGLIYNVRSYNIIDDFNPEDYIEWISVADPGENNSASVFLCCGLIYNNDSKQYEVHILKEYFHRNADCKNNVGIKLPIDYAEDYVSFIKECSEMMGKWPHKCLLDEDITFYRSLQQVNDNIPMALFTYATKNEVDQRVKEGINLLYKGRLRFHKSCTNTIYEYKNAVFDPDKILKGKFERMDKPDLLNIDGIDASEYGFTFYSKYLIK